MTDENKIYIITQSIDSNNVYSREFENVKAFSTEEKAAEYCNKYNAEAKEFNKTCDVWDKKSDRDYEECEFVD